MGSIPAVNASAVVKATCTVGKTPALCSAVSYSVDMMLSYTDLFTESSCSYEIARMLRMIKEQAVESPTRIPVRCYQSLPATG